MREYSHKERFNEAGENGGYILCPSDHFFDADIELIHAFANEALKCMYKTASTYRCTSKQRYISSKTSKIL